MGKTATQSTGITPFTLGHRSVSYTHLDVYKRQAQDCDDMFIRHLGTLKEAEKSIRKNLVNPFSCFSAGIKFIVSLPILLLHWFGFISDETTRKMCIRDSLLS